MRAKDSPRRAAAQCAQCGAPVPVLVVTRRAHGLRLCPAHRVTRPPRPPSLAERFWGKVTKNGPVSPFAPALGACWLWTGSLTARGYGNLGVGEHTEYAHAVALYLTYGRWPEYEVSHLCHIHACVNPAHLVDEDHTANMQRTRDSGRYTPPPPRRGERNPNSRLSRSDVDAVRALSAAGVAHTTLAVRFGLSQTHISRIVHGKSWGHTD